MQDLAAIFEDVVEASGMAGAQLSIIKGGERIDLAAGLRDVGQGEPMTVETTGQVGSVTKVFNAVLVLELVARGKLDLDEPIIRKIPELELGDADAASKITLRHLVSMSAGIDNGDYHYYDSLRERIENLRISRSTMLRARVTVIRTRQPTSRAMLPNGRWAGHGTTSCGSSFSIRQSFRTRRPGTRSRETGWGAAMSLIPRPRPIIMLKRIIFRSDRPLPDRPSHPMPRTSRISARRCWTVISTRRSRFMRREPSMACLRLRPTCR